MPLEKGREIRSASIGSKSVEVPGGYTCSVYDLNRSELRKAVAYAFRHVAPEAVWRNATNVEMIEAIVSGVVPASAKTSNQYGTRMATDKQRWRLVNKHGFGRSEVDRMTFTEASKAIQAAIDAEEQRQGYKAPVPSPTPNRQCDSTYNDHKCKLPIGHYGDHICGIADCDNRWDNNGNETQAPKNEIPRDPMIPNQSGDLAEIKSTLNSLVDTVDVLAANQAKASSILSTLNDRVTALESDMESVKKLQPKIMQVNIPNRETITIDEHTHGIFEEALQIVSSGVNLYLVGPAGTGKTTLGRQIANAMGLPFGAQSFSPDMMTSVLFGFKNALGEYVPTIFRSIYQNGGVMLFDECDNVNPSIATGMNMAIDNGHCAFPDQVVEKNKDTFFMAGANTYGTGATSDYIGRMQQDAAFLNRWAMLTMDYDEGLEWKIAHSLFDDPSVDSFISLTYKYRANQRKHQIREVFGTRNIVQGAKLLRGGMSMDRVEAVVLRKGISQDTLDKLTD